MMYVHYEQAVEAMTKGSEPLYAFRKREAFRRNLCGQLAGGYLQPRHEPLSALYQRHGERHLRLRAQIEETIEFLHSLPPMAGSRGVHAPGEGLDRTRAKNRENGIPVTEETWARILQAEKENVQKIASKF